MSQWEKIKCVISQRRLVVERNRRKFGTHGTTVHIWRLLLFPDSLSLVWGHSVKFPILQFWALLDYFSRAHEIEFRPSSVRRRTSVASIISEPIAWMLFFYEYFSFSLTWDPMGAKISKSYFSLKSLLNLLKPSLNFLLSSLHKILYFYFLNFEFTIFHDFFSRFR